MTNEQIRFYHGVANLCGFELARKQMEADGVKADDIIKAADFMDAVNLALALYNPADKGRFGKNGEVMERAIGWMESGRKWAHWGEFFARKSGKADVGTRTEMKTGCGDWLYSCVHSERSAIIAEYWRKETMIRWATEDFTIVCTWRELFDYLASYNAKGIETWFKSNVKYNVMLSKTVVMMQEYKTSKRKVAFLQNCPYCE